MEIKWGWKKDSKDDRDFKYSLHAEYMEMPLLPPSVSLQPKMSPVMNQGRLGSCVANATCGALEFLELQELMTNAGGLEEFDSQFDPISRLFVYYNSRVIDGDPQVDGGTQLRSAILSVRQAGICRESLWPYIESEVSTLPVAMAYLEGAKHSVPYGYRLDNTQITQLKQCLANGFPFIFGIAIYESFMSQAVAANGMVPIPGPDEQLLGGHGLCCVGYDDSVNGGSFLVRNSWSAQWGILGYCWIKYSMLTDPRMATDFWTLRKNSPES